MNPLMLLHVVSGRGRQSPDNSYLTNKEEKRGEGASREEEKVAGEKKKKTSALSRTPPETRYPGFRLRLRTWPLPPAQVGF